MADIATLPGIIRALDGGAAVRADGQDATPGSLMHGHFSVFDTWYRISSWFEGDFIERVAPGSFAKTVREQRDRLVVTFDHGMDSALGDKPLGPITDLREDDVGAYYEVPLLDTDYNRNFVLPALQGRLMDGRTLGSVLGASFMFSVTRDEWVREPKKSAANPDALPERTIREVRLYEFGPVSYPANPAATAKVRGLTDFYLERKQAAFRAQRPNLDPPAATSTGEPTTPAPADVPPRGLSLTQLRAMRARIA